MIIFAMITGSLIAEIASKLIKFTSKINWATSLSNMFALALSILVYYKMFAHPLRHT